MTRATLGGVVILEKASAQSVEMTRATLGGATQIKTKAEQIPAQVRDDI